jgi:hypothetical protein
MKFTFVIDERGPIEAQKALGKLPTDGSMEVVIQKHVKKRTSGQNRYQWKAILGDISRQVRIDGKGYTPKIWHEHLKGLFLPDVPSDELTLARLCEMGRNARRYVKNGRQHNKANHEWHEYLF